MSGRTCDIAIIGGGLAGGLIALALATHRPELTFRLVEAGEAVGGNHRWSWFGSDLSPEGSQLIEPLQTLQWDGNRVAFPAYRRQLATPYNSLASPDLALALDRLLPQEALVLRRQVVALDAAGATLADDTRIDARAVIDVRGFAPTRHLAGGWQVFMGRHVRLPDAHGIARPIIMDARVEQLGGYRFVYVLPLSSHEIFVEDTYYQGTPELDCDALSSRIDAYAREHGWAEGEIVGFETGLLPVITGGDFAKFQAENRVDGVAVAGARGGFVHPLTSYTFPFAVETALAIARDADLPGDQLAAMLESRARRHWGAMGFYRLLGSMLFGAAAPAERYKVFERFYRLPEPLIERFYAGRSTLGDKARILAGKPPVPVGRALHAMTSKRPPLLGAEMRDAQ